jgi:tartronate-semialdehyde synthase
MPWMRAAQAAVEILQREGVTQEKALQLMAGYRVPVVVEVILERVTNVAMGTELDDVTEFEETTSLRRHAPTAIAMLD